MATPTDQQIIQQKRLDALAQSKATGVFDNPATALKAEIGVGKGIDGSKFGNYTVQTAATEPVIDPAKELERTAPPKNSFDATIQEKAVKPIYGAPQNQAEVDRMRAAGITSYTDAQGNKVYTTPEAEAADQASLTQQAAQTTLGLAPYTVSPGERAALARNAVAGAQEGTQREYQKAQAKAQQNVGDVFAAQQAAQIGVRGGFTAGTAETMRPAIVQEQAERAAADPNYQRAASILTNAEGELRAALENQARKGDEQAQRRLENFKTERAAIRNDQNALLTSLYNTGALAGMSDDEIKFTFNALPPAAVAGLAKQARQVEQERLQTKAQQDKVNAQAQIKDLGANIAYVDSATAGKIYQQAGYSFSDGIAIQAATKKLIDAKTDQDKAKAQAELNLVLANTAKALRPEPKTDFEKKFDLLNSALNAGIIDQKKYNQGIESLAGIEKDNAKAMQYGFTTIDGKLYATNPQTGQARLVANSFEDIAAPNVGSVGNGKITYDYGSKSLNPKDNVPLQNGMTGTPGVDMDGNSGDPIQAFVSGKVTQASFVPGYGNQIIVTDESGNEHMYSHLSAFGNIQVGNQVNAGQLIGFMGNTGTVFGLNGQPPAEGDKETGSHLDYRVRTPYEVNGSRWANPADFIPKEKKPTDVGDYSDAQLGVLRKLADQPITATTSKALREVGLTLNDLGTFKQAPKQLTGEERVQIEDIIAQIKALEGHAGLTGAVGFGYGKPFKFIPGTSESDFTIKFNTLKDTLAIPNLQNMKGALSDKDIMFLRNTATSLDTAMSEEEFNKTLKALELKYQNILSSGASNQQSKQLITELPEETKNSVYQGIVSMQSQGKTDEQIKEILRSQGIDPSIFFKESNNSSGT